MATAMAAEASTHGMQDCAFDVFMPFVSFVMTISKHVFSPFHTQTIYLLSLSVNRIFKSHRKYAPPLRYVYDCLGENIAAFIHRLAVKSQHGLYRQCQNSLAPPIDLFRLLPRYADIIEQMIAELTDARVIRALCPVEQIAPEGRADFSDQF
ncbi:hypothetical protein [Phyllobacterium sp. P30BS-XVII]|uniref:hypothetical protein n=1 Tax=Phyllobacterium sp. P30BS-XVII TaxID=2587046 RepID=UPI0017BCCCC4|nr:hypothetical protein [Phyllobacterium sp. P30BS-XVII]MBA8902294.1 hypothetical protein [Phyllobacterium sp. P30BS-XVII]